MAKKGTVQIVQATTSYHYHVLPSDLARATISPERAAIFEHLSRIGPDRFVDFVTDLLVLAEGHKLVDRTDGPGDEKLDILTIDPEGRRHLTQCKHTENYGDNTSGDELDLLLGACFRKNCRSALYVTNADLTVQAKRYVTDREYIRGSDFPKEVFPTIDYWNGRRIWDRASKSNAVLNKWFGGMAQAHALRRFLTDLVITRMPDGATCPADAAEIATAFGRSVKVTPVAGTRSFDVAVDNKLTINLSDWFRGTGELGVRFLPPGDEIGHPNVPLKTLRVEVLLCAEAGVFDVVECRNRIAAAVGALLPDPGDGRWWHMLATGPQAFVFLQDVCKATLITLGEPESFVRVGLTTARERTWAVRPGEGYSRLPDPEDADSEIWREEAAGADLCVLVDQDADPLQVYEIHLRQEQLLSELRRSTFRAVENATPQVIDTVRRLCHPTWRVLTSSGGDLFWAYPPDADQGQVNRLEATLARRKVPMLAVTDEARETILSQVETAPTRVGFTVNGEAALTTPVSLDRRTFWFSKEYPLKARATREEVLEVIKFKAEYEGKHGHDLLAGRGPGDLNKDDIANCLADLISVRGARMLDVGIRKEDVSIHLRVRDRTSTSAAELAVWYAEEFKSVCGEVLRRLSGSEGSTEPKGGT